MTCSNCIDNIELSGHFQEPAVLTGDKSPDKDVNNIYNGITVCSTNKHIHVECCPTLVRQLFIMVEPELNRESWQERHAQTIELAQKEVLICVGLALIERMQKIHQKLKEAEHTCDLLFLTLLKAIRMNLDLAADKKRGVTEIDLLCEELEKDDKKKMKAEKKKKRRPSKNDRSSEEIDDCKVQSDDSGYGKGDSDDMEKEEKENVCPNEGKETEKPKTLTLKKMQQSKNDNPKNIKSHDEMIGYMKDLLKEEEKDDMKDLMKLFKYSIEITQKRPISPDSISNTMKTNKEMMETLISKTKTEKYKTSKPREDDAKTGKKAMKKKKTGEVLKEKLWCDNPGCSNKALHRCSGCLVVAFCSKQCSVDFWPIHRKQCFKKDENSKKTKTINCISEVD